MEEENKSIHSDSATCTTTLELSNSTPADDDPPPPPAADDDSDGVGGEPKDKNPEDPESESETARDSKRRKLCPSALEKCEAIIKNSCSNSSNCLSFTFDPKFSFGVSTPEVTPKFGSFNLVAEAEDSAEIEVQSAEEGREKGNDEVINNEKRKLLEILGSGDDGIGISAADYFEEESTTNVLL